MVKIMIFENRVWVWNHFGGEFFWIFHFHFSPLIMLNWRVNFFFDISRLSMSSQRCHYPLISSQLKRNCISQIFMRDSMWFISNTWIIDKYQIPHILHPVPTTYPHHLPYLPPTYYIWYTPPLTMNGIPPPSTIIWYTPPHPTYHIRYTPIQYPERTKDTFLIVDFCVCSS